MNVFVVMFNLHDRKATPYILRIPFNALNFVVFSRYTESTFLQKVEFPVLFRGNYLQWKPFAVVFKAPFNLATTQFSLSPENQCRQDKLSSLTYQAT